MSLVRGARRKQVRLTSRVLLAAQRLPLMKSLLHMLGRSDALSDMLVGYRRAFLSRADAEAAVRQDGSLGHADPHAIELHLTFSERARPSDYPALYHLGTLLPGLRRIVDIGGNMGNVFYCYRRYLSFPAEVQWIVHDLPEALEAGRSLAQESGESHLQFVDDLGGCASADLVLFSGSLHYFEALPPELLKNWASRPNYVLINRSPMGGSPAVYGVQDAGHYLVSAKVLDRAELLRAMDEAGYTLVDEWPVYELSLRFPLHPQSSAEVYLGQLFRLRDEG